MSAGIGDHVGQTQQRAPRPGGVREQCGVPYRRARLLEEAAAVYRGVAEDEAPRGNTVFSVAKPLSNFRREQNTADVNMLSENPQNRVRQE